MIVDAAELQASSGRLMPPVPPLQNRAAALCWRAACKLYKAIRDRVQLRSQHGSVGREPTIEGRCADCEPRRTAVTNCTDLLRPID
jgi:hypothetical protein